MNLIYLSGMISLLLQFTTGIFDLYVLSLPVNPNFKLIYDLLCIEFIVQIVELFFYVWLVTNFNSTDNITKYRYWDWFITTPTMLLTFCFYLLFIQNTNRQQSFLELFDGNKKTLLIIFLLNATMLFFGYFGEIGLLNHVFSSLLGFIPFLAYFAIIYFTFAQYSQEGRWMFLLFFGIWFLYGVASLMKYRTKNIAYNILDLLSKNAFGIFLAALILSNPVK